MGIKPWKLYTRRKNYKKRLNALGKENYECKLMLKAFTGLHKWAMDSIEKPKAFRKASLMQKAFFILKKHEKDEINEYDQLVVKYREVIFI